MVNITLSRGTHFNKDFSKQDLSNWDLSHSEFICCTFDDADLSGVDASNSKFTAGSMMRTKCTNTNFANTRLATKFYPRDCYGMTLTLRCSTFKGMTISKMWWYGWLYFAMMMQPEQESGKDPRDAVISAIGPARYLKLKGLFQAREI